jgi:hypothetical protein
MNIVRPPYATYAETVRELSSRTFRLPTRKELVKWLTRDGGIVAKVFEDNLECGLDFRYTGLYLGKSVGEKPFHVGVATYAWTADAVEDQPGLRYVLQIRKNPYGGKPFMIYTDFYLCEDRFVPDLNSRLQCNKPEDDGMILEDYYFVN